MPTVRVEACESYESADLAGAVRRCMQAPALVKRLTPGARVLLKPNVINPQPPERAVCTHPLLVRAVAEVCCEAGCEVTVADEPGYALQGDAAALYAHAGISQACANLPVKLDLLKHGGYREVQVPHPLQIERLLMANMALDADVVINLPKCKTHSQTLITGAIKNMFGAVAHRERIRIHLLGSFRRLGEAVADVFSACVPTFNVLDAVLGMEGNGPTRGEPVHIGAVLASEDAVALDAVAQAMLGFGPDEVRVTLAAAQKGLGERDLARIDLQGADWQALGIRAKRPPGGVRRGFPPWAGRLMKGLLWVRPKVIAERCTRCGACAGICPRDAIRVDDCARIDYARCIECFCCQEACPSDAIESVRSLLSRAIIHTGREGIGGR